MQDIPGRETIASWLVGFFWGTAALCYLFGGSIDLIVPLLSLGILAAVAKYITRNDRPT